MRVHVRRVWHNGHLVLTAMGTRRDFTRVYIGYTKREAIRLFRAEFKKEVS